MESKYKHKIYCRTLSTKINKTDEYDLKETENNLTGINQRANKASS